MKRIFFLVSMAILTMGFVACKEKKNTQDIITKMPVKPKKQQGPLSMSTGAIPAKTISWAGANYTINIDRSIDKELPLIEDASGNKFYDNKVHLKITRQDGSVFFEKNFTRENFSKYVKFSYAKKWGLTGFNFDAVDGNNLLFAIAIGSPDEMADNEFVPITLHIDRQGRTSVSTQSQPADNDEPQQKSEEDLSEEDGV